MRPKRIQRIQPGSYFRMGEAVLGFEIEGGIWEKGAIVKVEEWHSAHWVRVSRKKDSLTLLMRIEKLSPLPPLIQLALCAE